MILLRITTMRWLNSIREIGSLPARIKAGTKIKGTTIATSLTIMAEITEDKPANRIRTLKGTICWELF